MTLSSVKKLEMLRMCPSLVDQCDMLAIAAWNVYFHAVVQQRTLLDRR